MPSNFLLNLVKPKLPSDMGSFDKESCKSFGDLKNQIGSINDMSEKDTLEKLQKKICLLLDCYPNGINLKILDEAYYRRFGEHLRPVNYGFIEVEYLLRAIPSVFKLNADQDGSGFIVSRVYVKDSNDEPVDKSESKIKNITEDGTKEQSQTAEEDLVKNSNDMITLPRKQKLPLTEETKKRFQDLLNKYPDGLTIDEIIGAYRGFYGATLEDLDPFQYGYCSLDELLKSQCYDIVTLKYCGGKIMLYGIDSSTTNSYDQHTADLIDEHPFLEVKSYISLPAVDAVEPASSYKTLDVQQLFQPGEMSEVVVGEVFSPRKFWIMHRGLDTSLRLDELMDQMFEFYKSPIGERYKITNENLQSRAPVAALFKEDQNWYRAIVTSIVDLSSVRLFFIDYGTESSCFNKSLRKLHTNFFDLPAQAVEGSLHGIKPVKEGRRWPRTVSKKLLELLQDKALVANIIKVEKDKVYVSLWDTTDSDINISDLLVHEGLAKYEESSICNISEQSDISQQTNEDIDLIDFSSEQKCSSNLRITKNCETVTNNIIKNYIQTEDMKHIDTSKIENVGTAIDEKNSLTSNCQINKQPDLKNSCKIIKSSMDKTNAEFIKEENNKLMLLLDECNKLLSSSINTSEGFSNSKYQEVQPNSLHIDLGTIENETCKIDQPVPILASTPRHDNSTMDPAISNLSPAPKKPPPVPPGFNIKLPSSLSAVPPGYETLAINFNSLPLMQPEICNGADNPNLSSVLNQEYCELPIETQSTHLTQQKLSALPPPGFKDIPAIYSVPTEVQNYEQKPETSSLHDEIFYSDDDTDLCGSSLSLNVTYRTVECFPLTSNYKVHILMLSGAPYILSGDISQVLWETDKLRAALAKKRIDLPFIDLNQTTHPDIFLELIKLKAAAALDSFGEPLMSLFAYPLQVVPRILKAFKKDNGAVMKAFQELMVIYKEDADYLPFDESFIWPDHEGSLHDYVNEDNENTSTCSQNENTKLFPCCHILKDYETFESDITEPTNIDVKKNTSDLINPRKEKTNHETFKSKVISPSDNFKIENVISNENNISSQNIDSIISSNLSNKSLVDMDLEITNSSNKSTSDTSIISPESKSLNSIRKRMSFMYKKKQCDIQKQLANANNSKESIKDIKLPKELSVIEDKLNNNESFMLENIANSIDSKCFNVNEDKEKVLINDHLLSSKEMLQATNNVKLKTNSINKHFKRGMPQRNIETVSKTNSISNEKSSLVASYNSNFVESLPYDYGPMYQDKPYLHTDMNFNMQPSNTVLYHQYPQSSLVNFPVRMPHMSSMQGLPCYYYPVPSQMYSVLPMQDKYFKYR